MGFTRAASALILWLIPSTAPAAADRAGDPAAALSAALRHAEEALAVDEPEVAESRFRDALLEGWLLVGTIELEDGRPRDARSAFEHAAAASVETRRPHLSLALAELQLGEAQEAIVLLRAVLRKNRADQEARRLLARALVAGDQLDEAVQELEELRVLAPGDPENDYLLATLHLRRRQPEAAAALFAQLVERRPIPQTHVLIGRTWRDFEHYDQARRSLQQALAVDPGVRRAHYYLGTCALFEQGLDLLDEAVEHFEAELRVAPEDAMTNLYLGVALVEKRRFEEALPRLELAAAQSGSRPDAYQFLGRGHLALGNAEEAVSALRKGLELARAEAGDPAERGPEDFRQRQLGSLHYQLALAFRQLGDEAAAGEHFEAAKRSSARAAEGSRELLARYFENRGSEGAFGATSSPLAVSALAGLDPARKTAIRDAVRRHLARTYFNLGVLELRSERHARAAGLFEQAAELVPDFPNLRYSLAVAHFNSGRFERATAPLEAALAADPGNADLRRMLALARLNSGEAETAAELLRDDPQRAADPALGYAYAVALVRSGRAAEAESLFADLLASHPDWPELNVVLGQAHAQQHDYEAAVRFLERALELRPDVAEAHATLGDIYLRQGKLAAAEEALRAELRSHPEDLRARHTLAVVLDLDRKSEEALGLLRSLLAADPEFADGRYLLGKILLARGAAAEARSQLEAAARLAPEDPNVRYQLGQAYQKLGRTEEARQEFETYRRLKRAERAGDGS